MVKRRNTKELMTDIHIRLTKEEKEKIKRLQEETPYPNISSFTKSKLLQDNIIVNSSFPDIAEASYKIYCLLESSDFPAKQEVMGCLTRLLIKSAEKKLHI